MRSMGLMHACLDITSSPFAVHVQTADGVSGSGFKRLGGASTSFVGIAG